MNYGKTAEYIEGFILGTELSVSTHPPLHNLILLNNEAKIHQLTQKPMRGRSQVDSTRDDKLDHAGVSVLLAQYPQD